MSRPLVVDLYARLSRSPSDDSLEKVDNQLADCRAVAARNGWVIGREHRDNSLSAWRRGVRRPGWEALLARVEAGEVDGVLVWHTDRLLRQPRDLERLLEVGDKRGLVLASAYGEHDIANADHRLAMRIHAAVACKSSDDTSRRLKRRFASLREAGMTNGGARAFGLPGADRTAPKGEDGKRPQVRPALVARERAALRAAAEEIATGRMSLAGVGALWNETGLRTATGAQWSAEQVRKVLTRPINAGLICHGGVVVGRMPDEPILDQDLHERLQAVFAARRSGRPAGEHYLASGIILCGSCGRPLSGRPAGSYADGGARRQYHCHPQRGCGGVAADARRVDDALRDLVMEVLADPAHAARLAAACAQTAQLAGELAEQIAAAQRVREQLGDRLGRGEIDIDTFDAAIKPLTQRLTRLQAERDALAAESAGELPDPDAGADELARQWDVGDVAERRAMLLTALRGKRVRMLPAAGRVWSKDRIEVTSIPVSE
ncbi:MAG: recombinase family protein [Gemmatimonadota bacterium]